MLDQKKASRVKMMKVGVLMGGSSSEREISIKSGKAVLKALTELGYKAVGVTVDDDAVDRIKEEKIDVAYIALHGKGGEDGSMQGMLEVMKVPYTGSGVLACALSMDKAQAKKVLGHHSVPTPPFKVVGAGTKNVSSISYPVIVKPLSEGSSFGVSVARKTSELHGAIEEAGKYGDEVMIEKFIEGRELTVSILNGRTLPVIEILPKGIYDYKAKYVKGETEFKVPAPLNDDIEKNVKAVANEAYRHLGAKGVARVDLVLDDDENPFVLELNTVPGMTSLSLMPMAAASEGIGYNSLVEEILLSVEGV